MNSNNKSQDEYMAYIRDFGNVIPPQDSADALFDPQIKNISFNIAQIIASYDEGTILDVGHGNGIILNRLAKIDAFVNNKKWLYLGIDIEENEDKLLHLAVNLKLHKRVDFIPLKDFQKKGGSTESYPHPYLIIIRNVFHELDINATSALVFNLMSQMNNEDALIIQDLQDFPKPESGNACWYPHCFKEMLKFCGFDSTFVEEHTSKGIRWFSFWSKRSDILALKYDEVNKTVIKYRREQLDQLENIDLNGKDYQGLRDKQIALADSEFQRLALIDQLKVEEKEYEHGQKDTTPTALQIPVAYRRWIVDHCRYMDLKDLMAKGKAVRVRQDNSHEACRLQHHEPRV